MFITIVVSAILSIVIKLFKALYAGNIIMRVITMMISLGIIFGTWIGVLVLTSSLTQDQDGAFTNVFIASYLIDLFVFEILIIVVKIIMFPEA